MHFLFLPSENVDPARSITPAACRPGGVAVSVGALYMPRLAPLTSVPPVYLMCTWYNRSIYCRGISVLEYFCIFAAAVSGTDGVLLACTRTTLPGK